MSLWVVRAGKYGDQEETAINEHVICHGWNELPDYSSYRTRDELRRLYLETYPSQGEKQIAAGLGQVWRFAHEIQIGDLVALPLKTESAFQFGRVIGEYQYQRMAQNVMHIRKAEWLTSGRVLRSSLPKDILISMNSALTVFRVLANDAENRVRKILDLATSPQDVTTEDVDVEELAEEDTVDLEETARDEILKFIQANFKGHDFAHLIGAILRAQGYKTKVSSPGPDGGIDILAGSGTLGFEQPRLCVQVKSGDGAEGQKTYNEFLGVVAKFDSHQGLLVSWGGFTNAVLQDARKDFFKIRLWDQREVVDAVLQDYDRLDDDLKAELPLKKIWVMVHDEAE